MNWESFGDFVAMGGYGLYVWGSYGVTLAAMIIEPWSTRRRVMRALEAARTGAATEPRR